MNTLAALEVIGIVASSAGLGFLSRATRRLSGSSRVALVAIFGLMLTLHALDLAEWTGFPEADFYGDMLKVLVPILWILLLFFLTRDRLLSRVSEQGQQLEFFLEQAPMAIAIFDTDLNYVSSSQKWLSLFGLESVPVGEPISSAPPSIGRALLDAAEQSLRTKRTLDGLTRTDRSGKEAWFEWHFKPIFTEERDGVLLVIDDVTQKIEEEQARERAQGELVKKQNLELLGEIASEVAHDLNNLMQVIQAHAALLESDPEMSADFQESTASIRAAVRSASGMTKWMLALRRGRSTELEAADLGSLVRPTAEFLRRALPRSISLEVDVPKYPTRIWAAPTLIEQLVINLVINARDAMPRGGLIRLEVAEQGLQASLSVTDQGDGIDESIRAHILEPLFTTKGAAGTGLGLMVVQRAAEFHKADLSFTTELGKGTTFTIRFRLADTWTPELGKPQPTPLLS